MSTNFPTRGSRRPAVKPAAPSAAIKRRPPAKRAGTARVVGVPPTGSKRFQLIAMPRTPAGGTIEQLTARTGWQPHTARGTISGTLHKALKLNVKRVTRAYRILAAQA